MIYQPQIVFNLRNALNQALFYAGASAAGDFIAGVNKPWTYYLGLGFGGAAAATGIPGAAATLYVIGDTVDALLFKSPDGSDVRIFLNGILYTSLDTFAVGAVWETFNINGLVGGQTNRIDFVNYGPSANPGATGVAWFGIGPVTVNGSPEIALRAGSTMATFNISYSILDSDGDTSNFAFKVPAAALTLEQISTYATNFAAILDAVIDGQITDVAVTLNAALPGGIKAAPVGTVENQKGALLSMTTTSPYRDSLRVPAWKPSLFSGKNVNLADTAVDTFVDALVAGITAAGASISASDRYENDYTGVARAVKSFRR